MLAVWGLMDKFLIVNELFTGLFTLKIGITYIIIH